MSWRLIFTWTINTQEDSAGSRVLRQSRTGKHFVLRNPADAAHDLQTDAAFKVFVDQVNTM